MSTTIGVIKVGIYPSSILPKLLGLIENKYKMNLVLFNLLDYELPPKVSHGNSQIHRHELRNLLRILAKPDQYALSPTLNGLLKENDRLDLDDLDLAITYHISQIEQNSKDLTAAYKLLLKETGKKNISLVPLTDIPPKLLAFKNKKYAPLRYYFEKAELLTEDPPNNDDKARKKYDDKKLTIEKLEEIKTIKLLDEANKVFQDSDVVVILPTDIISLGILVKSIELEKQVKKIDNPLVLVWPYEKDREQTKVEEEITQSLKSGFDLETMAEDLANLSDWVIIDKSSRDQVETLRQYGCRVLVEDIVNENNQVSDDLIKTILNIADIVVDSKGNVTEIKSVKEEEPKEKLETVEVNASPVLVKNSAEAQNISKPISQLMESPEEAGIEKTVEFVQDDANLDEDEETEYIPEDESVENKKSEEIKEPNSEKSEDEEKLSEDNENQIEEKKQEFQILDDEEWFDSAKRAIGLSFNNNDEIALEWLKSQSVSDNDNEVHIAEQIINTWIEARTIKLRKRGAEIISELAEKHRDTYLQILQKHMMTAVTERLEDKRRQLIPLFSIMLDVDINFSEQIVRSLINELAQLTDEKDTFISEFAKLTILQLVINSRRLMKMATNELLQILDQKPNAGQEIWNILTSFDAGTVALELVTNFTDKKAEEIVRRSNALRFTGTFYTIISKVIQAWKDGDKTAISSATGLIIPEETLRKFERLELARKVEKLKMVQLSALAESLGKDVKTVERLVTELIVNDELHAELKLIDDSMYLVAKDSTEEQK